MYRGTHNSRSLCLLRRDEHVAHDAILDQFDGATRLAVALVQVETAHVYPAQPCGELHAQQLTTYARCHIQQRILLIFDVEAGEACALKDVDVVLWGGGTSHARHPGQQRMDVVGQAAR